MYRVHVVQLQSSIIQDDLWSRLTNHPLDYLDGQHFLFNLYPLRRNPVSFILEDILQTHSPTQATQDILETHLMNVRK